MFIKNGEGVMNKNFGEVLKEYREKKGFSVNQLAHYSEVSASLISRIENGKRGVPKPETIAKLAKALKVDYDELMVKAGHLDFDSLIDGFEKEEEKNTEKEIEKNDSPIPPAVQTFLRADTSGLTKKEQELLAEDLAEYFDYKLKKMRDKKNK